VTEPDARADGDGAEPTSPAVGAAEADVPEVRRRRDAELAQDGWVRRFTGSPPRLVETKELYESTGQEVLLDDVLPGELARECEGCTLALALFKVIYTRRADAAKGSLS
jgi:hypothetical protein